MTVNVLAGQADRGWGIATEVTVAESDDRETTIGWLREPPGAGEVRVLVECGDGTELTPGASEALERLMNELNAAEVEGYRAGMAFGPSIGVFGPSLRLMGSCAKLQCDKNDCNDLSCGLYTSKYA
jgi:hypothetical protein